MSLTGNLELLQDPNKYVTATIIRTGTLSVQTDVPTYYLNPTDDAFILTLPDGVGEGQLLHVFNSSAPGDLFGLTIAPTTPGDFTSVALAARQWITLQWRTATLGVQAPRAWYIHSNTGVIT